MASPSQEFALDETICEGSVGHSGTVGSEKPSLSAPFFRQQPILLLYSHSWHLSCRTMPDMLQLVVEMGHTQYSVIEWAFRVPTLVGHLVEEEKPD